MKEIKNHMLSNIPKHKVFISFHHADDDDRKEFENIFSRDVETFVSRSVQDGDIDPNNRTETTRQAIRDRFISQTSVTIVLIGQNTWKRKHVDWEIGYSIKKTSQNTRSGLIGILLPSYNKCSSYGCSTDITNNGVEYTPCNIPSRLYDNIQASYARIYSCPINHQELMAWIHEAFQKKNSILSLPDNSRHYFKENRREYQNHWQD